MEKDKTSHPRFFSEFSSGGDFPESRVTSSGIRKKLFSGRNDAVSKVVEERVRLRVVVGLRRPETGPLGIPDLPLLERLLYRVLP